MAFKFPDQHADETVLMVIRKHFVVYLLLIFLFFLIVIAPAIGGYVLLRLNDISQTSPLVYLALILFILMYVLFGILFLLITWLKESHDVFILTDERLIDVTQVTFFERTVATTPLDQIQDTTSRENGFLQTILNYGDVNVQTAAGTASDFFIDRVPDPGEVSRVILEEAQKHKQKAYTQAHPAPQPMSTDTEANSAHK